MRREQVFALVLMLEHRDQLSKLQANRLIADWTGFDTTRQQDILLWKWITTAKNHNALIHEMDRLGLKTAVIGEIFNIDARSVYYHLRQPKRKFYIPWNVMLLFPNETRIEWSLHDRMDKAEEARIDENPVNSLHQAVNSLPQSE